MPLFVDVLQVLISSDVIRNTWEWSACMHVCVSVHGLEPGSLQKGNMGAMFLLSQCSTPKASFSDTNCRASKKSMETTFKLIRLVDDFITQHNSEAGPQQSSLNGTKTDSIQHLLGGLTHQNLLQRTQVLKEMARSLDLNLLLKQMLLQAESQLQVQSMKVCNAAL